MNPPTKIELTEAKLLAGMRGGAGLKMAQARLLGVSYPPRSGWKKSLIGTLIDEERYQMFLSLRVPMCRSEAFSKIKTVVSDDRAAGKRRRKKARKERSRVAEAAPSQPVEVVNSRPATLDQTLGLLAARTAEVKELRYLLGVLMPVVEDAGLITDLCADDRVRVLRALATIQVPA